MAPLSDGHNPSTRSEMFSLFRYSFPVCSERLLSWSSKRERSELYEHDFDPGDAVYTETSPCTGVWILTSGKAHFQFGITGAGQGHDVPLPVGSILGLTETFAGIPYACTLRADADCTCSNICFEELKNALLEDNDLRTEIFELLTVELRNAIPRALNS